MKIKKLKLKKGDTVLVIVGKDRGKRGTIEQAFPKEGKIIITGINIVKHHIKPSRKNPQGGIMDKLAPIDVSNVVIVCPRCSKPSRIGYKYIESQLRGRKSPPAGGKKIRICKKCQESVD